VAQEKAQEKRDCRREACIEARAGRTPFFRSGAAGNLYAPFPLTRPRYLDFLANLMLQAGHIVRVSRYSFSYSERYEISQFRQVESLILTGSNQAGSSDRYNKFDPIRGAI
jgi:hypothetical protein